MNASAHPTDVDDRTAVRHLAIVVAAMFATAATLIVAVGLIV